MTLPKMTTSQAVEYNHIVTTRLGSLCGTADPTVEQELTATREAEAWLAEDRKRQAAKFNTVED